MLGYIIVTCYTWLYYINMLYLQCAPMYIVRIKLDPETQQMVLMGMGELHLDIVKDRLLKEHKLEVYLGKMLVAYRETIERPSNIIHHTLNKLDHL